MRRTITILLFAALLSAPLSAFAESPPARSPSEHAKQETDAQGWPNSRAGELARGWVLAFCAGESAMKEYIAKQIAPRSLRERNVAQRVEKYRTIRDKYGKLSLVSVVKEIPGELTVKLIDSDSATHDFVFTVQTESPYKLVSVGIREMGHGFGGFHH